MLTIPLKIVTWHESFCPFSISPAHNIFSVIFPLYFVLELQSELLITGTFTALNTGETEPPSLVAPLNEQICP